MPKFLNKVDGLSSYKCSVRLLENAKLLECEFQANQKGKYLLDYTCDQLNLVENDYFSLRYVDTENQRHWLDPVKSILKQTKDIDPIQFSFRVKFYPPSPFQLKEQITRYQIYLQLKKDLLRGRLHCGSGNAAILGAYILQAELGNFNSEEHTGNYASEFKIFLKQSLSLEHEMMEIHQLELKGLSTEESETNFLKKACSLDSYGVDPHEVKDHKGNQLHLGVNFNGILAFQNNRKVNHYRWIEIQKINYEGKMFIVHILYSEDPRTKKKETVGFKCPTVGACKYLWRCAIEQMLFFTSPSSSDVPRTVSGGGFFTGSKFRYTGRVEREILEEMAHLSRKEPQIIRAGILRKKSSSVPATPSTPLVNFHDSKFRSPPRLKFCTLESRSNIKTGDLLDEQCNTDTSISLEPLAEDSDTLPKYTLRKRDTAVSNEVENAVDVIKDFNGNFKESYSENALFSNRDQMDHSSTESHATSSASHRSSRSQTPVPKSNVHFAPNVVMKNLYAPSKIQFTTYEEQRSSFCSRVRSVCRVCLPTVILTLLSLFVVMIITFETNTEFFALLRRAPEMVMIRRQYYEPAKDYVKFSTNRFFKTLGF